MPGGPRNLTLREEFAKIDLINNMDNISRNTESVVILDALFVNLQSGDPVDVGVTLLFGGLSARVWIYQEAKLTFLALILMIEGFVDFQRFVECLSDKAKQDGAKFVKVHESPKRLRHSNSPRISIIDVELLPASTYVSSVLRSILEATILSLSRTR